MKNKQITLHKGDMLISKMNWHWMVVMHNVQFHDQHTNKRVKCIFFESLKSQKFEIRHLYLTTNGYHIQRTRVNVSSSIFKRKFLNDKEKRLNNS